MSEYLVRIFWLSALSISFGVIFFLLFGNILLIKLQSPIIIQDRLGHHMHSISGTIVVPTPCTELTVQTVKISSTEYSLELHTWDDPSVDCQKTDTPRSFNTVSFAPQIGTQFLVYLDGRPIPFEFTPIMPKK